jgi:membrane-bound metal-dependent hydrolase YbcI (DUF457 family)
MFIGHFAVGFASKKFAPRTSLAPLIAAPLLADMLWPLFLLLGWERVRLVPGFTRFNPFDLEYYPWSHSLLALLVWATLFAAIYYVIAHYRSGAFAIWIGVVSHWILDWITHRPDMPLYPGGPKFGLGLWNSVAGTMAVEMAMFAAGIGLYMIATLPRDRVGRYAFASYVALLLLLYFADRFDASLPTVGQLAWTDIVAMIVFIPWAWWFDRHREVSSTGESRLH